MIFLGLFVVLFLLPGSVFAADPLPLLVGNYPPFDIENPPEGRRGFDVEVVEAAFRAVGIEARTNFVPWKRAMVLLEKGKAAAVVTCARRKERESFAIWSDAISEATVAFVTPKEPRGAPYGGLESLRGRKVVAVDNYSTEQELTDLGIAHETVNSMEEGLQVVARRYADVFYVGTESARYLVKKLGLAGQLTIYLVEGAKIVSFHICVSKKWPDAKKLIDTFNRGLKKLKALGAYDRIRASYGL